MGELLSQFSAFGVFLAIACIGFLFLLISLIFGEIFDHFDFDHDIDHDLGHGGPGFFSTRVMSVFITAFGGFGAIGVRNGYSILASSAMGFGGGVIFASLIYAFARFLYSQQASSTVRVADLVGRSAEVIVAIPANNVGQIRCLIGESMVEKMARSRDGSPIPFNSIVTVEEVLGETVIVKPAARLQEREETKSPS
jgi:hypothetical protein